MKRIKISKQKVGNKEIPVIRLAGKWLNYYEFNIGDYIRVDPHTNYIKIYKI